MRYKTVIRIHTFNWGAGVIQVLLFSNQHFPNFYLEILRSITDIAKLKNVLRMLIPNLLHNDLQVQVTECVYKIGTFLDIQCKLSPAQGVKHRASNILHSQW